MNGRFVAVLATIAVTCAGAMPAAALGGADARTASSHTVVLKHNRFLPGAASIRRGDSVTWLWQDGRTQHNVVGHGFQSRVLTHGAFTVRFTRSGTYSYTCTVHAHMNGKVIVH